MFEESAEDVQECGWDNRTWAEDTVKNGDKSKDKEYTGKVALRWIMLYLFVLSI